MCAKSIDNVCAKACRNHTTKGAERASPMSARRSTVACLALAVLEQVTSCEATTTDGVTKVPPTTWVHCVGKVVTPLLWASWVSSDVAQLEKPSRHLSPHGYLHGLQPHHQPRRLRTAIRIKRPFALHLWGVGKAIVKPSGNLSRKPISHVGRHPQRDWTGQVRRILNRPICRARLRLNMLSKVHAPR